jgi:Na+/H+-translocating membrane pyrophosphatase
LASFAYASWITTWIISKDDSVPEMRKISEAIREGAEGTLSLLCTPVNKTALRSILTAHASCLFSTPKGFLSVQYGTIGRIALLVGGALFTIYLYRHNPNQEISQVTMAALTAASFLLGACCSALAG